MKLRWIATAILAFLVAVPVIATSDRFTDVPQDHEHRAAIDWAYNRELFKGYPDRSFKPDRALSENELQIVVKRLFDSYDEITRSQTAAILYYGITGLENGTTTTTTRPVITTTTTTTTPSGALSCSNPVGNAEWLSENTFRFPVDNSRCSSRFGVSLDGEEAWGISFNIDPYETGHSKTITWPLPRANRMEVTVVEYGADPSYATTYYIFKGGGQTTTTTRQLPY